MKLTINGVVASVSSGGFSASVPLTIEGDNVIHVVAVDAAGNTTDSTRTVIRDTQAPALSVAAPSDGFVTKFDTVFVRGTVADAHAVTVSANGLPLPVDPNGVFNGSVPLVEGSNFITIVATDAAGNTTTTVRSGTRDDVPPVLTLGGPADGSTTQATSVTVSGTVQDATPVAITVNGTAVVVSSGSFSTSVALAVGPNTITVVATDAAGNATTVTRTVTRQQAGDPIPPDPATVAPPLKTSEATTPFAATAFLYTGSNPIQTNVPAGTIQPLQASLVRGSLIDQTGAPLSGARVTVVGRPEFGRTITRLDGKFDLVVNGGQILTLHIEKSGYLPAERRVAVNWQDYPTLDPIALVALDTVATRVDFTAPQTARGSVTTDTRGSRRATMLFSQGTNASLVMPDGSTSPASALTIRATEYTVGTNGPAAMPAPLPPSSAYTYAVELSADEAIAAQATSVRFDKPVAVYVDNFLNFVTGGVVPVGYYDRTKGAWLASSNGRVITILDVASGSATLDVDGSGQAALAPALSALGIDATELSRLAALYPAGQSLWRFQVDHFSPWDANWPEPIRQHALTPNPVPAEKRKVPVDKQCEKSGSVIGCEKQTLGEQIAVAGTDLDLVYQSERVPGYQENYHLDLDLGTQLNGEVLAGLTAIVTHVGIAGRTFVDSFPPFLDQRSQFIWDGKDAYGRVLHGAQRVRAQLEYVYLGGKTYAPPDTSPFSFGRPSGDTVTRLGEPGGEKFSKTVDLADTYLGGWDNRAAGFGGWTLSAHHVYDPVGQTLYAGDGSQRSARSVNAILTTIAGSGVRCQGPTCFTHQDGEVATSVPVNPSGAVVAADGTVYLVDGNLAVVYAITPDGTMRRIAGTGSTAFSGDGGPATAAGMSPISIRRMPDGSLLIPDQINHRLRRIDGNGIITTIAGTGTCGDGGDNGPAIAATICNPQWIAVANDGTIYLANSNVAFGNGSRVRRIAPDGMISTFAGSKTAASCFYSSHTCHDSLQARNMVFGVVEGLAFAPDGSLYVGDNFNHVVWNVGIDGIVRRIAGDTNTFGASTTDGRNALVTNLGSVIEVAVGPDGSIYTGGTGSTVRRIGKDGIVTTAAGMQSCSSNCSAAGGAAATQTQISFVTGLIFGPDQKLYISDLVGRRLRRLEPPLPGFNAKTLLIPSEDGGRLFKFDSTGRQLATIDALTGATLLSFGYDGSGNLATITDESNNTISITRTGSGATISTPDGITTSLSIRADGFLGSVTSAGRTVALDYTSTGLLKSLVDPEQRSHTFSYDTFGRLTQDADAAGATVGLTPSISGDVPIVTATTNLGRQETHRIEQLPNAALHSTTTLPAGTVEDVVFASNDSVFRHSPSGVVQTAIAGADPRFGSTAPVLKQMTVTTPSGLRATIRMARVATLAQPGNPLSLTHLTDSLIVGGRIVHSEFDATTRTVTDFSPSGRTFTQKLDAFGRSIERTESGAAPIQFIYDARGRISRSGQGPQFVTTSYGTDGRISSLSGPLGQQVTFAFDSAGNLKTLGLPGNRTTAFTYDRSGNVLTVTPAGETAHQFTYYDDELIHTYVPPTVGSVATPTIFSYNADRQLTQVQFPTGSVAYGYDAAGRLSSLTAPTGTRQFEYDPTTGNLSALTTSGGIRLAYQYDGDLPTSMTWSGSVAGSVGVQYDAFFRVKSISLATDTAAMTFDADGQITQAGLLGIYRNTVSGFPDSTRLNAIGTTFQFDNLQQLTQQSGTGLSLGVFRQAFAYDSLGRVTSIAERIGADSTLIEYGYDAAGRLGTVKRNGVDDASYFYDGNGNRTRAVSAAGDVLGTFDAQDRQSSAGSVNYSYTLNGALSQRATATDTTRYQFDLFGNLVHVDLPNGTSIDYIIDGQNRRIGRSVNGTLVQGFLYQSQFAPIAELDGSNNVVSRFVYGSRSNVPDYMAKGGQVYRLITDHLGSVRLVVNTADGTVAQRIDYDAFGRETQNTNPGFQPFGFGGGLVDEMTGLVRFGMRDYDPALGRWTSKDALGFAGPTTNLYEYVGSDPVNLIDPTGRIPIIPMAIGAGTSVASGWLLAKLLGQCYGWQEIVIDAAAGAVGEGLATKFNQIRRVARLREIAEARGLENLGREGYIETWEHPTSLERLKIKFEPAKDAPGPGSSFPRFAYRIGQEPSGRNIYWDPFTGATGPGKGPMDHIPLDPPLTPGQRAVGGAEGQMVIGQALKASRCGCKNP